MRISGGCFLTVSRRLAAALKSKVARRMSKTVAKSPRGKVRKRKGHIGERVNLWAQSRITPVKEARSRRATEGTVVTRANCEVHRSLEKN